MLCGLVYLVKLVIHKDQTFDINGFIINFKAIMNPLILNGPYRRILEDPQVFILFTSPYLKAREVRQSDQIKDIFHVWYVE